VALCGHATLASAHILWEQNLSSTNKTLVFHTKSGELRVSKENEWYQMDFPSQPPTSLQIDHLENGLLESLGLESNSILYAGKNEMDLLLVLATEKDVANIKPNFGTLKDFNYRCVIVSSTSSTYDFVSRVFAPNVGVNEDPVTGSAYCLLGPYWSKILGKEEMLAYQSSKRGGTLKIKYQGKDRILLLGKAVTVFKAQLLG